MSAPDKILELVERFNQHRDDYRSGKYKETQLRIEFINPMFEALGWDVGNTQGNAERYKEVIHEYTQRAGGTTKAPDYCFRIGSEPKFFLEAKKPSVDLEHSVDSAFQLRRYAWTANLSLSILTDFEEFAVYDCRFKPDKTDKASKARVNYVAYTEYADRWDEISSVFSRDAVRKGSFDKYADSNKKKRGTSKVDEAFLKDIEAWRELLAKNIARHNPNLAQRELNDAVQRTIDRIIFLRICEDRGIERYAQLQALLSGDNTYARLTKHFRSADDRYNSGLFHFRKETDRTEPDAWTLNLAIDDKVLKKIIKGLYYPDSPYEFSVLPADILGQVYEQFLGKVIRLTKGHQAKIEDKPEVKKAGGVYYTPTYIVDYIVENTVGKLIEDKTPEQVAGKGKGKRPLSVLDPACGSGSFLLGAYQYLLDWYLKQYEANPKKYATARSRKIRQFVPKTAAAKDKPTYILTLDERKRILLDHLHGVDIDTQAVEVTKLSLLLKVLETEDIGQQVDYLQEQIKKGQRALPDLSNNIKCGNSLIGPDFYQNQQLDAFDEEEMYRINAFDWHTEFKDIMASDGFDSVIGNPPYVFSRERLSLVDKEYYEQNYKTCWEKPNTYMLFMELLPRLVSRNGTGAYIVPNSWLTIESAKLLRKTIVPKLLHIADLNYPVFYRVSMEPCIFVISGEENNQEVSTLRANQRDEFRVENSIVADKARWSGDENRIHFSGSNNTLALLDRIIQEAVSIGKVFQVRTGMQAYEKGKGEPPQSEQDVKNHVFDRDFQEDKNTYKYLGGKDVQRYGIKWSGMWLRYGPWLSQPRELSMFERPRIIIREITGKPPYRIFACFSDKIRLNNKSILNVLHPEDDVGSLYSLLGVMNSRLISKYYEERAVKSRRKLFPKLLIRNLREFPYPATFQNNTHSLLADSVNRMLDLHKRLPEAKTGHDRTLLQRQIDATDAEIDRLVYDLYGLTDAEIKIVEDATTT